MKTCLRSAGIWISEGQILLESLADREVWGIPGGSVQHGESIQHACVREYLEETGLTLECSRLAIVHESFWNDNGQDIHEYGFYFIVQPAPNVEDRPFVNSLEGHLKFHWFPLSKLQVIMFVPHVLINYLADLPGDTVFVSTTKPNIGHL